MIRGWDPILPGCRWLYELPPISDQRRGWGFHTMRGGIDPGDHHVRPQLVGEVDVQKDL